MAVVNVQHRKLLRLLGGNPVSGTRFYLLGRQVAVLRYGLGVHLVGSKLPDDVLLGQRSLVFIYRL